MFNAGWQSIALPGFPIRKSVDITPMCGSPRLIAACHVLHRLLMPRHSPCALYSLTSSERISYRSFSCVRENSLTPSLLLSKSKPLRWVSIWYSAPRRFYRNLQHLCFEEICWFSQELCRPQIWFIVVFVLPYFKVHKLKLCYLSVACSQFLACFTVQFSRCSLQPFSRSD